MNASDDDFSENLSDNFDLMEVLDLHNLFITDIDNRNRRALFLEFLKKQQLYPYSDDGSGKAIIIQSLKSPADVYNIYNTNNDKLIIFDTDKLFTSKKCMDIAEGGFCSNPDSGKKWPVRLDGKKDFMFTGHVIILSRMTKGELYKKKERFHYVLRDMAIL